MIALGALAVVLVVLVLGSAATTPSGDAAVDRREQLVTVDEDSSLWPYTSSATKFEERTLAINVLVAGEPTETRRHLEERSRGGWNETAPEQEDVSAAPSEEVVGTATAWGSADGSTRYVYVATDDDPTRGTWLDESYQLHDGEYLGSRHHIRAYASPHGDEWTAMQAHREYWDWFRLSHTVTSAEDSQRYVEREFMGREYVSDVSRDHLGNDRGFDSDGWVTIIDLNADGDERDAGANSDDASNEGPSVHLALIGLLPGVLLGGRVASRTAPRVLASTRVRRGFVLAGALIGLYLFVRFGAIAVEARLGSIDPRFVAGAFYPLVVVGLPVCAYYFARPLDRPTAFAAASVGFATAILLDYTALGVTRLPVTVFVHRFSTAIALGFIAVGASHAERIDPEDHGFVRMGALLWGVTLLVPLLRFL